MKKILAIVLAATVCLFSNCVFARTLANEIDELIAHTLPNADIGIIILDAKTGQTLYQHNAYQPFNPASNTKLFSNAAALYYLGPDYHYHTTVQIDPAQYKNHQLNGNIYIQFDGDPSFNKSDLFRLVARIHQYGITQINGNIVINNFRFQAPEYPAGASYEDINWYYAAPIDSIIINRNAFAAKVIPGARLGDPARVIALPDDSYFKISSDVKTVNAGSAKGHCNLYVKMDDNNHAHFYGCVPISKSPSYERVAVHNPLLYAKQIIENGLKLNSIRLDGKITVGTTAPGLKIIADSKSASFQQLMTHTLKHSDNVYADSFLKTLGSAYYGQGTFVQGVSAVKAILAKHSDVDFNQMELADGSGTRFNLIPPRQIADLLYAIYKTPKLNTIFINALPDAGVDGSLAGRMSSYPHKIHAKTGTMHDISALSGYINAPNKHDYIFSIVTNHVIGNIKRVKWFENRLCSMIIHQYG